MFFISKNIMYSFIKMHPFMFVIFFSSSFSPLVFALLHQHRCWHQTQEEGCRQKPGGDTIVTWCIVMQSPTFVILWRVGSRRGSCLAGRDNRSIYQHNFKSTQSRRKKGRVKGPVKHECQRVAFLKIYFKHSLQNGMGGVEEEDIVKKLLNHKWKFN